MRAGRAWPCGQLNHATEIMHTTVILSDGHDFPFRYSPNTAPTIVRNGQFRLFFFPREETRIHVHVAQAVVEAHLKEIQDAWIRHFGG